MRLMTKSLFLAAACTVSVAASASTTVTDPVNTTTAITVGNWSFTMSGCAVSGSASCSTDIVVATATASSLSLVFEGAGGSALETTAAGSTSDLTFTGDITVTAPTGLVIYSVGENLAGTASSGTVADQQLVTVTSGNITHAGVSTSVTSTNLSNSPTLQTTYFTPVASVSSLPDFKTAGARATSGSTLTLTSATLVYNAPEPMSLSLLAAGLAGIGFVKRKVRRSA